MKKIEKPRIQSDITKDVAFLDALDGHYIFAHEFDNCLLTKMEIDHLHLDGCIFKNVIFEECCYENMDFLDCIFDGCDLSNIQMVNGCIHRCEFINCRMVGSDLSNSVIHNTLFSHNNARYINMSFTKFKLDHFENNDMMSSSFNECIFKMATFHENRLVTSEFINSDLSTLDLSTCNIEGITLTPQSMKGLTVSSLQAIELSKLLGLKISDE